MTKLYDTISEPKITPDTEKQADKITTPYQTESEYLQDVIDLFQKPNICVKDQLERIEKRLQGSKVRIAFEEALNQYHFNRIEKFCILKAAHDCLFTMPPTTKELFKALYHARLCPIDEAAKTVLSKESPIYTSKVLAVMRGMTSIKNDMLDKFLGVQYFSSKGNLTPSASSAKATAAAAESLISPIEICRNLDTYIIGQQQAKESLSAAVYEHLLRCRIADKTKTYLDKTNVLLIGPTGTGKTYLCRMLAKSLNMPFYMADASQMTDTGYVGLSADSILTGLQAKIKDIDNKFPPSIIYLDEIDKVCFKDRPNDVSGKSVQEEFLKLLESDVYTVGGDRGRAAKQYDISNVMFIAGGAFSGIDKIIAARTQQNQIGFAACNTETQLDNITTEDLEKYGFMPEFLGRFTKRTQLQALTEQDLADILTKTKDNPLAQYRAIFKEAGIVLKVPSETIQQIARRALSNQTGARGLKNELSDLLGAALFTCKKEGKKQYVLKMC